MTLENRVCIPASELGKLMESEETSGLFKIYRDVSFNEFPFAGNFRGAQIGKSVEVVPGSQEIDFFTVKGIENIEDIGGNLWFQGAYLYFVFLPKKSAFNEVFGEGEKLTSESLVYVMKNIPGYQILKMHFPESVTTINKYTDSDIFRFTYELEGEPDGVHSYLSDNLVKASDEIVYRIEQARDVARNRAIKKNKTKPL